MSDFLEPSALQMLDNYPVPQPIALDHNMQKLREMRIRLFGLGMLPFAALGWLLFQLVDSFWLVASVADFVFSPVLLFVLGGVVVGYGIYAFIIVPRQMAEDPPLAITLTRDTLTLVPYGCFGRLEKQQRILALKRDDAVIVRQYKAAAPVADILLASGQLAAPLLLGNNRTAMAQKRADNLARTLELARRDEVLWGSA